MKITKEQLLQALDDREEGLPMSAEMREALLEYDKENGPPDNPMSIRGRGNNLRKRLETGEITDEQYQNAIWKIIRVETGRL